MRNIKIEGDLTQGDFGVRDRIVPKAGRPFTPGDFFRDAGVVIATCLGVGLLMQVLLG